MPVCSLKGSIFPLGLMMPIALVYPSLLEGYGLRKKMDLYAYLLEESSFLLDRLDRITAKA